METLVQLGETNQPPSEWAANVAAASMALAQRTSAGATIWAWAPQWPPHAEHVAVEFVHPVVVGTRALPAEAVDARDPAAALRTVVSAGDVLVVVADDSADVVRDVLRRAPAWGVETIWIGTGVHPAAGSADHVVWVEAEPDAAGGVAAVFDGRLVLSYHVLWELTHVCYEHPGLLQEAGTPAWDADAEHCVTCSDEGRVAEVVRAGPSALVRTPAGLEEVDATLVDPLSPGDLVLVHAGVAMSRLGEHAAATRGE